MPDNTSITQNIHHPAPPKVFRHKNADGSTHFLAVNIGGTSPNSLALFFDTLDELTAWSDALSARVGALQRGRAEVAS